MQITAPVPIFYLPENLWSLFTRPGRELTVRVLQIEGKLLYLELGGYKFQARLAGTLNPEDLRVGDLIRVKVTKSEGPVVLQIIGSEKEEAANKLIYLFLREKPQGDKLTPQRMSKELTLLTELFRGLTERKEKGEEVKNWEEIFGKEIKFIKPQAEEDKFFLPFVFSDERSWGYIEVKPEEKGEKVKLFSMKIFFSYLGLVEVLFAYTSQSLELDLYFAEKKALTFAKEFFKDLRSELYFPNRSVIISFHQIELRPGFFLERIG